jgi:hypothetical protein
LARTSPRGNSSHPPADLRKLLTAAASGTTQLAPSATVVPIQVTGPAGSRFNLVVMGDGYTAAELLKFREQADKHLKIQ